MPTSTLLAPETIERQVLVAVELFDPVILSNVNRGLTVFAQGLSGAPITSWSGRYVWLRELDAWPSRYDVSVDTAPYQTVSQTAPPKPADLAQVPWPQRLTRIVLTPTPAYPFPDGLTVIRGRLRETAGPASAAVVGATVGLKWEMDAKGGAVQVVSPMTSITDAAGEFALMLRPPTSSKPTLNQGKLSIQIQATRGGETRSDIQLSVVDGALTDLPNPVAWSDMQ
ncbi:hypothetical protein [Paraburkholderia sp. SIMBA_054]|uniref:hypothetical protein n=1 Tax=Paraburkholderia sp. SIMBA_054 TaxID=3085795 RepID=UPI003979AEB4